MIKNCFKILANSFVNVWKILLFKVIVLVIGAGLCAGLVLPNVIAILARVSETGFFENLRAVVVDFFTRGSDIALGIEEFKNSAEAASHILAQNATRLTAATVVITVIIVAVNMLGCMADMVAADIVDAAMSSDAKYGFMSRFIITAGTNAKYQLVRLITEIPLIGLVLTGLWFLFTLLFQHIYVFSLLIVVAFGVVLISVANVFFSMWLPSIVTEKKPVLRALGTSFKMGGRQFSRLFSHFILINLLLMFVNVLIVFFTCGAGLLVTLPACTLFTVIFRTVNYYHSTGRKYYCGEDAVFNPKNIIR